MTPSGPLGTPTPQRKIQENLARPLEIFRQKEVSQKDRLLVGFVRVKALMEIRS